jgi:hypothetical protein
MYPPPDAQLVNCMAECSGEPASAELMAAGYQGALRLGERGAA